MKTLLLIIICVLLVGILKEIRDLNELIYKRFPRQVTSIVKDRNELQQKGRRGP